MLFRRFLAAYSGSSGLVKDDNFCDRCRLLQPEKQPFALMRLREEEKFVSTWAAAL